MRRLWAGVAIAIALGGCLAPTRPLVTMPATGAAAQAAEPLWGRIFADYAAQAVASDLLANATVTLLNSSNQAVATGLTDAAGAFSLNPFVAFAPTTNAIYALDAVKSFGASSDRAALRYRTLVSWDGTKWLSLAGTTAAAGGAGVVLSGRTTALAVIRDLRARDGSLLLGKLDPATGTFTEAAGVTSAELDAVAALVSQALAVNLDPVRWVVYTASDASYRLGYAPTAGKVLFDLDDAYQTGTLFGTRITAIRGRDGGRAFACGGGIAIFDGQIGGKTVLSRTLGVAADLQGNVYAPDLLNYRIKKFAPDGTNLWTFGSKGDGASQFWHPVGIAVDDQFNLLVTDYAAHQVKKFDANGNLLWGIGQGSRWTSPAGTASSTAHNGLTSPHHSRFDQAGSVWISDTANNRLLKYDRNGNFVRGIGGGGTWTDASGNTALASASDSAFSGAMGVAIAPNGDVYAADRSNNRIQVFDSNGVFLRKWGTLGAALGQLSAPEDVVLDNAGHVWVAESANHRVQKFDRFGTPMGFFGGNGSGNGEFANARGIAYAPDGAILVGDDNNNRVQRLLPTSSLAFRREGMLKKGAGTVSFWVKPSWAGNTTQRNYLVEFDDPAVAVQNEVVSLFKENGILTLWYRVGGQPQQTAIASVAHWKANEWHHVAFTWSASKVSLYLDGGLASNLTPNVVMLEDPLDLYVGRNFGGGVTSLEGTIDQFRTFDYAKSVDEIARDMRGLSQE